MAMIKKTIRKGQHNDNDNMAMMKWQLWKNKKNRNKDNLKIIEWSIHESKDLIQQ